MKINKKLISLISLLATSNSYAIQQFNVNNNAEVEASISNNDVSRIAVVGAKINQVKFSNSQLKIDTDDENGQIFVYPTGVNNLDVKQITVGGASKEATVSPLISLFIIDDHGRSYNLRLRLSAVPSETILINPIHAHCNTSSGIAGSTDFTNQVVTIVEDMYLNERDANGYDVKTLNKNIKLWKEVQAELYKNYKNSMFDGNVFYIRNKTNQSITLSENQFWKENVVAVSIEKPTIDPDEITRVFVVGANNE